MQLKQIADTNILFVMAVPTEYGTHLQDRFIPLFTGIGPVEAGVVMTEKLTELKIDGNLPDLVVSLGSAGSQTLQQAEVYQGRSASYRDMDASPLGYEKGVTPFIDHEAHIALPLHIPNIPTARIATGGSVVSGKAYDTIDADLVDMETFAILRATQRHNIPLIALRGISDGVEEVTKLTDWTQYLHVVDEKLAAAVDQLEAAIAAGTLDA